MAIIGRMDKAVATAAVFSITILEGGGMVLAKYFRDEGRDEGREESRAEIEALRKRVQELEARNGNKSKEEEPSRAQARDPQDTN